MPCPLVSLLNFLKTRHRGGQGTDRAETALENQPRTDHIRSSTSGRPGPRPVLLHTSAPAHLCSRHRAWPQTDHTHCITPAASRQGATVCGVCGGPWDRAPVSRTEGTAQTTHSGWEHSEGSAADGGCRPSVRSRSALCSVLLQTLTALKKF